MATLTTEFVWQELEKEFFAVLGMVTAKGEARQAGVIYIVHYRKLYINTSTTAWKTRHIKNNPHISVTVPIPKRVPFMPWIKIPSAVITFSGLGKVSEASDMPQEILAALIRGRERYNEMLATMSIIEIEPQGNFLTYGVGVSLIEMRDTEKARGRAPVA